MAASYGLAVYSTVRLSVLPAKYLWPGLFVSLLLVCLLLVFNFRPSSSSKRPVGAMLLSLAVIAASLYAFDISRSATNFLRSTAPQATLTETYSIIAKKDRAIRLDKNTRHTTAFLDSDSNGQSALQALKAKTTPTPLPKSDIGNLTISLDDQSAAIALVSQPVLRLIQENAPDFYQSIKLIDTLKVKVAQRSTRPPIDLSKPFVLYISGIDTYGQVGTTSRSDVNILAAVNPQMHRILLVNTPRDYYVQLHGTTGVRDKLTHAGVYGIDMSTKTLEDLYAVPISSYLRINFSSLVAIVDTIGGVDVESDYAFGEFHKGTNHLDGKQALTFSRERYAFNEGDRTRGQNQQKIIEAIIAKLNNRTTLVRLPSILQTLEGSFQTNIPPGEITGTINRQLNDLRTWKTTSISVDGIGQSAPTYSMGSQLLYVMEPDIQTVDHARQQLNNVLQNR